MNSADTLIGRCDDLASVDSMFHCANMVRRFILAYSPQGPTIDMQALETFYLTKFGLQVQGPAALPMSPSTVAAATPSEPVVKRRQKRSFSAWDMFVIGCREDDPHMSQTVISEKYWKLNEEQYQGSRVD